MSFTVTITGVSSPVEVYAGLTATKDYVAALYGDAADAFIALTDNDKSRILVAVTRYIDRWTWDGEAGLSGTTLQFPRTALLDSDGTAISDATQLAAVASAVGELCALAAEDPDVLRAPDTSANIQSAGAGGAQVTFFNPTSAKLGTATPLPQVVQQLLGAWLGSTSGATALGGDGQDGCSTSDFAASRRLDRNWPW